MVAGRNAKRLMGMEPQDRRGFAGLKKSRKKVWRDNEHSFGGRIGWKAELANGLAEEAQ